MNKRTKKTGFVGVSLSGGEMFVGFGLEILIPGNMSQGFHGIGLLTKEKQRICR